MSDITPTQLSQRIIEAGLLEQHQIEQVWSEIGSLEGNCDELIRVLQRKELVTNLQIDRLLKGERTGYFYGKWKILYLIGAGTFARVYRSVHRDSGRIAAVKVLRRRHRNEPEQVEQFMREAKVGLQLRHPNIVAINEVDPDPRNPFMVMEFVEGQTLRELVQIRKKLDPITSMSLMADVANGLQYAATLGVTHRDMKLSNVLVTSQGRAKLVDFGLAAIANTSDDAALADCPSARAIDYAALERGTAVRKDDPRSDLYFLGAMLYHVLTGESPLTETRDRLARLNVSRFREIPHISKVAPEIPSNVASVVQKAIEFSPTGRYQTAAEAHEDFVATLERLKAGDTRTQARVASGKKDGPAPAETEGKGKTIMLVESKIEFQDLIREKLKKRGYRVLVISDPTRAMARFNPEEDPAADCVLFSAPELGAAALNAFNDFGEAAHTAQIPALLLVDRKQQFVIRNAKTGEKRKMLAMPLKVRELRTSLLKMLSTPVAETEAE
ncbi:MAG TPA: serine/threonine protein kinase [Planctomycetaceae bacterium]|nr:serine/threonine protein kinase [Planctomycetaceae bacterium]